MECPYCAEDVKDEAIVCKNCSRDLRLVRPILIQNAEAIAELDCIQHELDRIERRLARRTAPLRYWARHALIFLLPPIILLLAAHYVIVIRLDKSELYLRVASMLVPLPFGLALMWVSFAGIGAVLTAALLVGIGTVAGMFTVVGLHDAVAILPETARDWREAADFSLSIALAFAAGSVLALLLRRLLPSTMSTTSQPNPVALATARFIGQHVGEQALRRRARKIQGLMETAGPAIGLLATIVGAVYAGMKNFFGL